jgi:hypothetical protein
MISILWALTAVALAAIAEKPAVVVEGEQAPARIARATLITPAEGPPVVLYAAASQTDQRLDEFTVMVFIFKADGTLHARHAAPGRRTLEPRETKYSTVVLDGAPVDATDVVVIGINQAQVVGSSTWWRADLQPAAQAAVSPKK